VRIAAGPGNVEENAGGVRNRASRSLCVKAACCVASFLSRAKLGKWSALPDSLKIELPVSVIILMSNLLQLVGHI
jgi:hypothetical protein